MVRRSNLCSVNELRDRLDESELSIVDGSWAMPAAKRDTSDEFLASHIPGAVHFDIDSIRDLKSSLPHMLPNADQFARAVGHMGIANKHEVIVYDSSGLFSAARVWWMFKVFGHARVRVLNGGLPAWLDSGNHTVSGRSLPVSAAYEAQCSANLVAQKSELITNLSSAEYCVLDARSKARFMGQAPEPRAGLSAGHMPGSVSLEFNELIEAGQLKSVSELREIFAQRGVTADSKLITSCGSGVTAAIVTLALAEAGYGMHPLYDGSWSEWASASDTIILDANL